MTISEAIPYLLKYHWIRRKSWRNECDIAIFGGVVSLSGFRTLFEEDIAADDWEVIAMPILKEKDVDHDSL
jgi:hypothetical protein